MQRDEALRLGLEGRETVRMTLAQHLGAEVVAIMVVMAMGAGHAELADAGVVERLAELEGLLRRAVGLHIYGHAA
jgi:hypothetical protein